MRERVCGTCTLCCKLVPVSEIGKPADTMCQFCNPKAGCRIYRRRPLSCRAWSCLWLIEPEIADAVRPDLTHVVFDMAPDQIIAGDEPMSVIQAWVDPEFPDAWRAPAVLAAIEQFGDEGLPTLVRIRNERGIVVCPPRLASDGKWHFVESDYCEDRDAFNAMLEKADG